jgi:adenylate cyclase
MLLRVPNKFRIRTSLLTMLASLILVLAGAQLFVSYRAGQAIAEDLGGRYLEKTRDVVNQELDSFFLPVMTALKNARVWARSGVVDPLDMEKSNAVYLPVLESYPQVTSIATGDVKGYSYRLGASKGNYKVRLTYAWKPGRPADFRIVTPEGELVKAYHEESQKFDPRERPWYVGARAHYEKAGSAAAADIFWTAPFILNTSKNPGIAAALPFEGPEGDVYMMTFNFMLTKLSNFTAALRPSPNGVAFVLTEEGRIVGFPATDAYPTADARLSRIKELDNQMPGLDQVGLPVLARAQDLWSDVQALGGVVRRRIELEDGPWRTIFERYQLPEGPALWIGVAVPEEDFLAQVREQQRNILWVSGLALLGGLLLAIWLARTYSRPLRRLAAESRRITQLDLTPGEPIESHVLEAHELAETQESMRTALDSFSRYIPTGVVKELLKRGEAAQLGGAELPVTILFTDIRGFTTISEGMTPDALSSHLAEYFESMMDIIGEEGGAVDKMIGDAIMAIWGAPTERADHARGAVRAAVRCSAFVREFNRRCDEENRPPLWTGFGIATGPAFVGNFGAPSRLNYTALGDVVNLASRLEGANKVFGSPILCSEATRDAVGDEVVWLHVDNVGVKGKTRPEPIFEPLALAEDVTDALRVDIRCYERCLEGYYAQEFEPAELALTAIEPGSAVHPAATMLRVRCKHYLQHPPGPAWDGVWWLGSK